jgi:hypothetical protein
LKRRTTARAALELVGATGREEFRLLTSAHPVVEAVDERAAPDLLFFVEGRSGRKEFGYTVHATRLVAASD